MDRLLASNPKRRDSRKSSNHNIQNSKSPNLDPDTKRTLTTNLTLSGPNTDITNLIPTIPAPETPEVQISKIENPEYYMSLRKRTIAQQNIGTCYSHFYDSHDEVYSRKSKRKSKKSSLTKSAAARKSPRKRLNMDKFSNLEKILFWREAQKSSLLSFVEPALCKQIQSKDPLNEDLGLLTKDAQCLFVNINWAKPGLKKGGCTLEKFSQLNIAPKVMRNGILAVWSSKNLILQIIETMEQMKFSYIENICVCKVVIPGSEPFDIDSLPKSAKKLKSSKSPVQKKAILEKVEETVSTTAENLDWEEKKQNFMESLGTHHEVVEDCFLNQREKYIKCTKRILLLFRRNLDKTSLELRHQRNPDAFFDIVNPENPEKLEDTTMDKIYDTMETMLPQTKIDYVKGVEPNFRMVELFANPSRPRKNWIQISQI